MDNNKQELENRPFFRTMSSIGDCVALLRLDSNTELGRIFNVNSNLTTMPCARDAWHFIKSKFLNQHEKD